MLQPKTVRNQKGSAMMEFTFMAVQLLMLLFGIIEMSRIVLIYNSVAQAARAGARYAMVHGNFRTGSGVDGPSGPSADPSEVLNVVKNFAGTAPLDRSLLTVNVTYPDGTNTPGSQVQVAVSYPYDPFMTYFNLGITLRSTSRGIIVF